MKPAPFGYLKPASIDEALEMLQEHGDDAKIIAGGQSLMPLLNMRLARPGVLIDINGLSDLTDISEQDSRLHIGAICRQRRMDDHALISTRLPILTAAARLISHPQIRSRGTIVGSVVHGDPSAELPAIALALDAELSIKSTKGERALPVRELYQGYYMTAVAAEELVTEIRLPIPTAGTGWSIQEISRRHGDFALAGVVAFVTLQGADIGDCTLVFYGLGESALRLESAEQLLRGQRPGKDSFRAVAQEVSSQLTPDDDVHASAQYRCALAHELTIRALEEAVDRATAGGEL
ncbi:MAG: xanthine dehydrogenase family protein subunit M [Gammaproteobacteria bacterium]|jgi:aerobic carbon-monoxide dehydrogenase medium subunit|nr:xanthine dehydrogenase family protein subunit M [Gammaproteobacteria bacterium]MBT4493474.1 xanthine dehydrogenase family protein subunit M [Gammaproteobacteria bacterium]MBT7372282.1 xanthine dehydrogenase family protein subunit M [Gammaproteobacteria bacterium]